MYFLKEQRIVSPKRERVSHVDPQKVQISKVKELFDGGWFWSSNGVKWPWNKFRVKRLKVTRSWKYNRRDSIIRECTERHASQLPSRAVVHRKPCYTFFLRALHIFTDLHRTERLGTDVESTRDDTRHSVGLDLQRSIQLQWKLWRFGREEGRFIFKIRNRAIQFVESTSRDFWLV